MNLKVKSLFLVGGIVAFSCLNVNAQTKKPAQAAKPTAKTSTSGKVVTRTVTVPGTLSSNMLKNQMDSVSYAIGINVGDNIRNQKLNVNPDIVAKAIKDALSNNKSVMSSEASGACLQAFFQKEASKAGGENQLKAAENKKMGDSFLAQNKAKEGVKVTATGLQYKVLNEGSGAKPAASDKVKVHYHGTLIDGTVFDSSVNRGEPAEFGVTQVIPGWVEALQMMPVGSKWTLYIPSELAYGQQGPPSIGPSQVLVFDVELLDIIK
jgi:FKBP-type peptidyl-prolyl cis-trans isomerase FklB